MSATDNKLFQDASESRFELIEFKLKRRIGGQVLNGTYGVNVVKVREVVRMPSINPLNTRVRGMAGIFELRSVPIPVVNLASVLGDESAEVRPEQKVIVTEFGTKRAGFIVDATHRIRRIEWKDVLAPSSDAGSYITAMTLIENNEFLFILDFERILHDLDSTASNMGASDTKQFTMPAGLPQMMQEMMLSMGQAAGRGGLQMQTQTSEGGQPGAPQVLLVDDSPFILKNTKIGLNRAGYNVFTAENGKIAYEILEKIAEGTWKHGKLDAVITDIEMPQMDGFTLTKKIREHATFVDIPIIIHSSLSGKATQDTGIALGANGYIVKNDIRNLVEALSEIIGWKPHSVTA
jgi:two-component system, chemotaxis family, chemotaxis protein CheV